MFLFFIQMFTSSAVHLCQSHEERMKYMWA